MSAKKLLFLDDNDERAEYMSEACKDKDIEMIRARTAAEAISLLEKHSYDYIFLDHDLGDEVFVDSRRPDTGMEVVRWMVVHEPKTNWALVHTWNLPAGNVMVKDLMEAGYIAISAPFGTWAFQRWTDILD